MGKDRVPDAPSLPVSGAVVALEQADGASGNITENIKSMRERTNFDVMRASLGCRQALTRVPTREYS
jgi:hypothetical protein